MLGAILAGSNLDGSGSPVPNVPCRMLPELMGGLDAILQLNCRLRPQVHVHSVEFTLHLCSGDQRSDGMLVMFRLDSEFHYVPEDRLVRVKCGCCSQVAWRLLLRSS